MANLLMQREIDFDQMDYDDISRYIMDGNTSNSTIALLLATPENIMDTLNIAEYRNMIAPPIFNFDQQRLYDNLTSLASYLTNTNTTLNMLMVNSFRLIAKMLPNQWLFHLGGAN